MVEIIPKPTIKAPLGLNILLYFSIVLLIIAVLSIFVLDRLIKNSTDTLDNLKAAIGKTTPEETALRKEISDQERKLNDFSSLLDNHRKISKSFSFLENLSHPKAWFSSFSADPNQSLVRVSGLTESFQTLGEQLIIFQNPPLPEQKKLIKSVALSEISIGEGGKIGFTFTLSLDPQIFKYK